MEIGGGRNELVRVSSRAAAVGPAVDLGTAGCGRTGRNRESGALPARMQRLLQLSTQVLQQP